MAVSTKKYKLFKVCKELNVGMDTLSSFIEEKGVKIKGPNTAFPEEIYIEILEQFAKDKESADIILKRKKDQEGLSSELGVAEEEESAPKKKPAYVEIIEKSIEEGVEEIIKEEVEEKKPEKKKTAKSKKEDKPGKKEIDTQVKEEKKEKKEKDIVVESAKPESEVEELVKIKEVEKPKGKEIKDSRILGHIDIDSIQGKKSPDHKKTEKKVEGEDTTSKSKDKKKKKSGEDKRKRR